MAFGIWTSQVGHVLASQCLLLDKPKTMKIDFIWKPSKYFSPKDAILLLIKQNWIQGWTGYAIKFCGEYIREMSMEWRMTVCKRKMEFNKKTMQKFKTVKSEMISLKYKDIDTDMIIPAEYLKTTTKTGLWKYAFINMKKAYSDFLEFWKKEIIVVGKNFWCGSSREHTPWALLDIWIKVII